MVQHSNVMNTKVDKSASVSRKDHQELLECDMSPSQEETLKPGQVGRRQEGSRQVQVGLLLPARLALRF